MQPTADPLWYKDAIIYELHVRAFHDSDGDGYGDFRGLTQKVDYLEDLGVTVIWLLPFYPSPLKDDGYDIADYTDVHHRYGRLDDFKEFLAEAHKRNIRVITELVVNHTSDQHPWFQRARRAEPGSPERDFYVWSDSPEKYKDARIIFKDFEPSNWSWDPVAKQYYWHRFYSHQPDLNFDNPAVWQALFPILDFWMDLGVDGMRLDAIPYLFEREGTNCENLPETHEFLKALRRHADAKFPGRMFLAEANQWPEDAVAYFGNGDECHMAFHFPVMPRLFMALHQEDRFPILDILAQTPAIPETCQWCMFLRNHDELTLEMVTDEERDYMYRAYATDRTARINLGIRHRLAPLLRSDRRRIELMNALLASLPGTPVIYYGDEIGMGDNIYLGDRNGVRTPMQWSADRNAGYSRANPQKLYLPIIIDPEYHFEAINVEAQQSNPNSLLWWMKRLIALRKRHKAFGRGSIEFLRPENPKVLAFIRSYEGEHVLMVANLSRFVQYAELDLKTFRGLVPQELFGRSQFPPIHDGPYSLTIGPHGFYWFALTAAPATPLVVAAGPSAEQLPALPGDTPWAERLRGFGRDDVEALLPDYLRRRQFFRPEAVVTGATITDAFPIRVGERDIHLLVIRADFRAGMPETIVLATTRVAEGEADQLLAPLGQVGFVRIEGPQPGVICDALFVPECCTAMLKSIESGRTSRVGDAELAARPLPGLAKVAPAAPDEGPPVVRRGERHNVTLIFGNRLLLKVYRRLEEGISPELEVGRFLTERQQYRGAAPVVGYSEIRRRQHEPATTGVLYEYVPNQGDAWQYTLDQLSSFFERVAALPKENPPVPPDIAPLIGAADHIEQGERWQELFGGYGEAVRLMAQRTAEMHRALAADRADPVFAPESFTRLHQRSLYQSLRNLVGRLCSRLARERHGLPEPARELSGQLLARQEDLMQRFKSVLDRSITGY
ncbi:MAG: maltose alpha-D-glucosyltransferase, partial [Gemmataceae bacterium]